MTRSEVAYLAGKWVRAEQERKMRKYESRLAWLLAFKAGVQKKDIPATGVPEDGYATILVAETDAAQDALLVAREAKAVYIAASRRAGSLRGALTRQVMQLAKPPVENAAIRKAYDELCERECAAAGGLQ